MIDLGHSKKFPGANGVKSEIAWNREIWKELKPLLDVKKWSILEVPTDYPTDTSSTRQLINRIAWINKRAKPEDFLLSIHANAFSDSKARGIETCYFTGSKIAEKYATMLTKSIMASTGVPMHGDGAYEDIAPPRGRIAMVRDTKPFALLVECGFVTSPKDMAVSARKYAEGITKFWNSI